MTRAGQRLRARRLELTSIATIRLDYIPPPVALAPFVTTFYHFGCDEPDITDIQPASVGLLILFLKGQGEMLFAGGRVDRSHPAALVTPTSYAVPFAVDGPFHCIGAALSPLGWAALTGLDAGRDGNRMIDATQIFGSAIRDLRDEFADRYGRGDIGVDEMVARIGDLLLSVARPVPDRHVALIGAVAQWLGSAIDPDLAQLFPGLGYSERQAQRLVQHYFGAPPKLLKRKYRALRAATMLAHPDLDADSEAAIHGAFYDQPHMTREIGLFAGRTPARLGDASAPIANVLLDEVNFREVRQHGAQSPAPPRTPRIENMRKID